MGAGGNTECESRRARARAAWTAGNDAGGRVQCQFASERSARGELL